MRSSVAALITAVSVASAAAAVAPPCSEPVSGWCVARRVAGDAPAGELGFRFGEPLDVDGDGAADVAAGARFVMRGPYQAGRAGVWSGATGTLLRAWDWPGRDALFGHWVLPVPDLDGDGLADLLIAAPLTSQRGVVVARSPRTGAEIWRRPGPSATTFGWDLALAGDHDGDGSADVFVGQPAMAGGRVDRGRVHLVSGTDGGVLRTYAPAEPTLAFGWYVARVDDLDGDGRGDLAVGAPPGRGDIDPPAGRAYVFSSASGRELRRWTGTDAEDKFAEIVAAVGDLDGDGRGEVAVSASTGNGSRGAVRIYSGTDGRVLREWSGTQVGELYGRMIVSAGDLDADGVDDVAIGAPWYRGAAGAHVGRVELRSGRSGTVLSELVGEGPESWFGWHIRRAPDPEGRGRPALLIGSLRQPVAGVAGTGVIDLYVRRAPPLTAP